MFNKALSYNNNPFGLASVSQNQMQSSELLASAYDKLRKAMSKFKRGTGDDNEIINQVNILKSQPTSRYMTDMYVPNILLIDNAFNFMRSVDYIKKLSIFPYMIFCNSNWVPFDSEKKMEDYWFYILNDYKDKSIDRNAPMVASIESVMQEFTEIFKEKTKFLEYLEIDSYTFMMLLKNKINVFPNLRKLRILLKNIKSDPDIDFSTLLCPRLKSMQFIYAMASSYDNNNKIIVTLNQDKTPEIEEISYLPSIFNDVTGDTYIKPLTYMNLCFNFTGTAYFYKLSKFDFDVKLSNGPFPLVTRLPHEFLHHEGFLNAFPNLEEARMLYDENMEDLLNNIADVNSNDLYIYATQDIVFNKPVLNLLADRFPKLKELFINILQRHPLIENKKHDDKKTKYFSSLEHLYVNLEEYPSDEDTIISILEMIEMTPNVKKISCKSSFNLSLEDGELAIAWYYLKYYKKYSMLNKLVKNANTIFILFPFLQRDKLKTENPLDAKYINDIISENYNLLEIKFIPEGKFVKLFDLNETTRTLKIYMSSNNLKIFMRNIGEISSRFDTLEIKCDSSDVELFDEPVHPVVFKKKIIFDIPSIKLGKYFILNSNFSFKQETKLTISRSNFDINDDMFNQYNIFYKIVTDSMVVIFISIVEKSESPYKKININNIKINNMEFNPNLGGNVVFGNCHFYIKNQNFINNLLHNELVVFNMCYFHEKYTVKNIQNKIIFTNMESMTPGIENVYIESSLPDSSIEIINLVKTKSTLGQDVPRMNFSMIKGKYKRTETK